jgi:plastocyanin
MFRWSTSETIKTLYKIPHPLFFMHITRIMHVLGIICIFAAITAMLTSFIPNSTFSVEAQQTVGVNVSIVKDAALKGDTAYQPNPVNVTIDQEVIWTNDDSQIHTVTSGTGPSDPKLGELFDSGILSPGDTFRFVFNQTGEIPYYCTLHPQMVGIIESASVQQNTANISSLGQMMTQDEEAIQRGGGQGMSGMSGMTEGGGEMEHGGGGGQGMSGMSGMTEGGGEMEHGGGQGMSGMSGMTEGGGEMEHGGEQGMSGMSGMEHGSGGQGMSGMSGMEHGSGHTPGMTNEMCHMGEDMPPHYCEPSYQVMSSVKGVKISDVNILNDTSVMVTVSELNPMSNNTVEGIVIVGGGGDLAGSTILEGNWKQNTTSTLNFVGTGSAYSTDKLTVHIFPFNG